MDYEWQITLLEKELAHAREMHQIMRSHVDAHDLSIQHIGQALKGAADRFERAEARLDRIEAMQERLTADVQALTVNMNSLVNALLREHPNGKE